VRVLERFSWTVTAQATVEVYRRAITEANSGRTPDPLPVAQC
jgi:hypothetical protein